MAVVKIDALTNLAAAIGAAIPALVAKIPIAIQQAPSAVMDQFPNAELILPGKLIYDPAQRLEQQDLGGGNVVWNVGAHEGPLQIRITCNTTIERATFEQQVIDLFNQIEGSPGILPISITSSDAIQWLAAFEYEDSQWSDVNAQSREYEAIITCNAVIPALVTTPGTQVIDTLVLGFTNDTTDSITLSNFGPPLVELVQVNQDGSITPFTP